MKRMWERIITRIYRLKREGKGMNGNQENERRDGVKEAMGLRGLGIQEVERHVWD